MHFLPPVQSTQRLRLSQILKDLSAGQLFSLLDHLRAISTPQESEDAVHQILKSKLEYFWLLKSDELESCLRRIGGPMSQMLLRHFSYNKRHFKHLFKESSPYVKEGQILWQVYLRDYAALQLNEKRHLFVNLRNYLEWSKIQKTLRDDEMISKIFFPLAEELLEEPACPLLFVLESVKLVLKLNPRHSKGIVFYSDLIINLGEPAIACDFLHSSVRRGMVNEEVLKKFLSLVLTEKREKILEEFSQRLSKRNITHLGADFYYYLSNILYKSNFMAASVFYACKAIAYGGQRSDFLLHLCRVLISIEQFELATELLKLNELEKNVIYFLPDEDLTQLYYRFGSLESMQPLSDACVILPQQVEFKGKLRVEIQDLSSSGTHILYPDGWGPYRIGRIDGKLQAYKVESSKIHSGAENSANELVFGEYRIQLSLKWICGLTPFQFSQSRPN